MNFSRRFLGSKKVALSDWVKILNPKLIGLRAEQRQYLGTICSC
jgi:hypothetical protein